MPTRAKKEVAAPVQKDEAFPLLQFGADLFTEYQASAPAPAVTDLQMARFADYVHHFGFSVEREQAISSGTRTLPSLQPRSAAAPSVRKHAQASMVSANEPTEDAGWGMPEEEKAAADAHCASVGALRDADPQAAALANRICEPFHTLTWRQSRLQCALKKTRCLYLWLGLHVRVILESEVERAAAARAKQPTAEDGKKAKGKSSSRVGSPTKKRAIPPTKGSGAAQQAGADEEAESPPPDPLEEALRTRVATPRVLADLYAVMLNSVGVPCEVVRGWVKGSACEETYDWFWNIVQIDGKHYLVDLAASTYTGPLRPPKGSAAMGEDDLSGAATTSSPGAADVAGDGTSNSKAESGKKKRGAAGARSEGTTSSSGPQTADPGAAASVSQSLDVALRRQVRFETPHRGVEDFYFLCHPLHFIYTHLPVNDRHTLLVQPPHRTAWANAPRLTHDFFRFPVSLHSHQRSAAFTTRSTPFYISLVNKAPATTELACKVYRGSLTDLPERMCEPDAQRQAGAAAAPQAAHDGTTPGSALSQDWIWQQRCESTQMETFTIMTPDVGYYSVVIGARAIRADPYGATIASTGFTPLVGYQVKVNFVPVSAPLLPRQHLSPSVCRLMSPLCAQVQAGSCAVAVMPACSNVTAVAVVVCHPHHSPPPLAAGPKSGAASGGHTTAPAPVEDNDAHEAVSRELVAFLPFQTSEAVYSGTVSIPSGTTLELWVLYTAPDENGLTFRDRVQHRVVAAAAAAAVAAPVAEVSTGVAAAASSARDSANKRASKSKGRKNGAPVAPSSDEDPTVRERAALSALLSQGRAFRPFVTGIEARKLTTSEVKDLIQPQPTIEEEREPTLRRLIGVTDALYQEATLMRQYEAQPVGTYLDARAPGTAKERPTRL